MWQLLMSGGNAEIRSLRNDFFYILGSVILIPILQLFTNGWGMLTAIIAMLCIAMIAWRLVNIRRVLVLAGVGELAELLRLIEAQTGFPPNQIVGWYLDLGKGVLFFACAYFLTIPLINFREWWPGVVFLPFLFSLSAAFLGVQGGAFFRFFGGIAIIFWIAFSLFNLFPQLEYYSSWEELVGKVIPTDSAKEANEIDRLRNAQRAKALRAVYKKARVWQLANPGRDLPEFLRDEMEATKSGLSVSEYQEKKRRKAKPVAPAISQNSSCGRVFAGLIKPSNSPFARTFSGKGATVLGEGSYCMDPPGAVELSFADESHPRAFGDSKGFTVPKGKKVTGIRSDHEVRIYKQ